MDSFEDILARVLARKADRSPVAPIARVGKRPLRDPETDTASFFNDINVAVRNIRSPDVARALAAPVADDQPPSSSAEYLGDELNPVTVKPEPRKTTLRDDAQVAGELANAASAMVKSVVTAGKAVGDFAGNAKNLDSAVDGMAKSVETTGKKLPESFSEWFGKNVPSAAARHWFGADRSPPPAEKGEVPNRLSSFLNSSSIADSVRGLLGRLKPADGDEFAADPGIRERADSAINGFLARSMDAFRSMSRSDQGGFRGNVARRIGRAGRRMLAGNFKDRVQRGGRMLRRAARSGGANLPPSSAGRFLGGPMGSPGSIPGMSLAAGGGGAGGAAAAGSSGGAAAGGGIGGWITSLLGGAGGGAAGGGGGAAAAGGAAAGAAGGLTALTIATGGVILVFVGIVAAATAAGKALYDLGMKGYETSLRVAQYDGALAGAKAQLEVGRLMRDVQSAERLSSSGEKVIKAFDKLEETLRPFTDQALIVGMEALAFVVNLLVSAFNTLIDVTVATAQIQAKGTLSPLDDMLANMMEAKVKELRNPEPQANVAQGDFFRQIIDRPLIRPRNPLPPLGNNNNRGMP